MLLRRGYSVIEHCKLWVQGTRCSAIPSEATRGRWLRLGSWCNPSHGLVPAEEVHSLLKALTLFQLERQAEKLQQLYEEALQTMEAAVPEVWPEGQHHGQTPVRQRGVASCWWSRS